jgi:hypothetical protein
MAAVLLTKQLAYIFNSDPSTGSQNLSADGSSFEVSLNNPISIPRGAVDCVAGVVQSAIWSTSPNISPTFNNNVFKFTTTQAPAGTYTLNIPQGLYSIDGLNTYLSAQYANIGLPTNLILITGDQSTQSSILTFEFKGDSVDFTVPNSVRTVLGFNSEVLTAPSANYSFYSESPAAFNRVNSFVIASNIVSQGIPVNNQSEGIIALVPITVPPGSQINFQPYNVSWFECRELIGQSKTNMTFRLLNQSLLPTPTSGDYWSFTLVLQFSLLISSGTLALRP